MEYGYARVSTKEQNEERQLIALRAAGLHNHQIFLDKQSGKDFNRCIITAEKQAAIVVLDMPLLDTHQTRDLTGTLIADIVLQLLSYVAQTEREFIHQRQAEGIAAAKARGVKFGRPYKELPAGFQEVKARWERGELSARAAGKELHIAHSTFLYWVRGNIC